MAFRVHWYFRSEVWFCKSLTSIVVSVGLASLAKRRPRIRWCISDGVSPQESSVIGRFFSLAKPPLARGHRYRSSQRLIWILNIHFLTAYIIGKIFKMLAGFANQWCNQLIMSQWMFQTPFAIAGSGQCESCIVFISHNTYNLIFCLSQWSLGYFRQVCFLIYINFISSWRPLFLCIEPWFL